MDMLNNIMGSEDKNIIMSLPKNKTWLEYLSYFMELKTENMTLRVIIGSVPKTSSGKRCYFIYDGFLRGYMEISIITETKENEICLELNPIFTASLNKYPMVDVEDYKYYLDNSGTQ